MTTKPNILLLIVDSLRADHVHVNGYDKQTTPVLDELAKQGITFTNHFSAGNGTEVSITSMITGTYPSYHGINSSITNLSDDQINVFLNRKIPTVAKFLKGHGYRTVNFSWLQGIHREGYDEIRGNLTRDKKAKKLRVFRNFIAKIPFALDVVRLLKKVDTIKVAFDTFVDDRITTDNVIDEINKASQNKDPFFMQVHLTNVHQPYKPPKGADIKFTSDQYSSSVSKQDVLDSILNEKMNAYYTQWFKTIDGIPDLLAGYDNQLLYVDGQVGRIIDELKKHNMFDDTLIFVTADHGESFTEKEIFFGHHQLYNPVVHTPLIIKPHFKMDGTASDQIVQFTDIFSTIIDFVEPNASIKTQGFSLKPIIEGAKKGMRSFAFAEDTMYNKRYVLINDDFKLHYSDPSEFYCPRCKKVHGERIELYALDDKAESKNLASDHPKVVQEMIDIILAEIKSFVSKRKEEEQSITGESTEVDAENLANVREELKKMGYVK